MRSKIDPNSSIPNHFLIISNDNFIYIYIYYIFTCMQTIWYSDSLRQVAANSSFFSASNSPWSCFISRAFFVGEAKKHLDSTRWASFPVLVVSQWVGSHLGLANVGFDEVPGMIFSLAVVPKNWYLSTMGFHICLSVISGDVGFLSHWSNHT